MSYQIIRTNIKENVGTFARGIKYFRPGSFSSPLKKMDGLRDLEILNFESKSKSICSASQWTHNFNIFYSKHS